MTNNFGIPKNELLIIRARDKTCIYCHKIMINPYNSNNHGDSATIEHLSPVQPFYMKDGMKIENIAICCGSCNSSRSSKKLRDWFKTKYCIDKNINENTVAEPVKDYLKE
jgi:hypothetical protein